MASIFCDDENNSNIFHSTSIDSNAFVFSNNDHHLNKKKKSNRSQQSKDRWNRSRRAHPFPRILKRDIRRNYPFQLLNAINSGDESLYLNYFTKYCLPDCILSKSKGKYGEEIFPFQGPYELVKIFKGCFESMPDFNIVLLNSQIRINPQTNESKILLKVNLRGTIVQCPETDLMRLQDQHTKNIQKQYQQQEQSYSKFFQQGDYVEEENEKHNEEEGKLHEYHEQYVVESMNALAEMNIDDELCNGMHSMESTTIITLPQPMKSNVHAYITLSLNQHYHIIKYDSFLINSSFSFEPIIL